MNNRMKASLGAACLCLSLSLAHQSFAEGELLLNEIQLIGSHNSYKKKIDPVLLKFLRWFN